MNLARLTVAAVAGGAIGAGLRAWLTDLAGPATEHEAALLATLAINIVGSGLLAALPALAFVRRSKAWPVFLGTGVLGGFTTMSTAIALPIAALSPGRALGYLVITLAGALFAVWTVNRLLPQAAEAAALVDQDR